MNTHAWQDFSWTMEQDGFFGWQDWQEGNLMRSRKRLYRIFVFFQYGAFGYVFWKDVESWWKRMNTLFWVFFYECFVKVESFDMFELHFGSCRRVTTVLVIALYILIHLCPHFVLVHIVSSFVHVCIYLFLYMFVYMFDTFLLFVL